ncbi:glycosyltransferase family 4 protein [Lichenifustis flavocetrariae]|uniref:Glycosyltransferase family 4 protein n=1 Tax=Lichenifustis flavocetrariae TaxID=2949735 RepID=A0AA41Z676_9HYPH|nr:glycosyltransferase family 4 protein [Lichenifustis flavocetrariae]MCW6511080.1 glycosyltransferase family 4 protein [Lichenifustis flavocetrariae]
MKVIHVVRQFAPSIGGLEEAVLKLCLTLQKRGVETAVVTLDRIANGGPERLPGLAAVQGVEVRRIPFRGSFRYPVAPAVLSRIGDADIVHVHGIDFFFDFLAATRWIHRRPLVASTHGGFFHTAFAQQLKRAFFQTATRTSAHAYRTIFASSDSDLDLFRPIAARKLMLAANGVDFQKWRDRGSRRPIRTLLYIGRFSSNKNLAALFPVLCALRKIDPSWSLIIAGRPWDVTTAELREGARSHAMTDAVTILDSPSDNEIAAAIGHASYIVSASRHEGFGISIVEGLSAGLVPVLSRIPPFAKLIGDAGLGLLTDFDAAPAAAASIEAQHLSLLDRSAEMRATALASVDRYSWDAAADIMHRAYTAALDRRANAPTVTAAPLS